MLFYKTNTKNGSLSQNVPKTKKPSSIEMLRIRYPTSQDSPDRDKCHALVRTNPADSEDQKQISAHPKGVTMICG